MLRSLIPIVPDDESPVLFSRTIQDVTNLEVSVKLASQSVANGSDATGHTAAIRDLITGIDWPAFGSLESCVGLRNSHRVRNLRTQLLEATSRIT